MEKITIVIPVYNVEKYLEKCLDSILSQTYTNLDILCINDGSTDHSLKICQKYQKKDSRIRVIDQENKGLAAVRNIGIRQAEANIISFIDSDDYIDPDFIEKLYACMIKNKADIVVANVKYENAGNRNDLLSEDYKNNVILNREEAMKEYLNVNGGIGNYIVNKLYDRKVFNEIEFPENRLFEDAYTMFKILNQAQKIVIEKNVYYHYCLREDSITGQYDPSSENFDLLKANKAKSHFICEEFPNLSSLVFHQYFIAFTWTVNKLDLSQKRCYEEVHDFFEDLKYLKKHYDIHLIGLKNKIIYVCMSINLKLYSKVYKLLKNRE